MGGQGSVLIRQQEGGHAAVALGDDPEINGPVLSGHFRMCVYLDFENSLGQKTYLPYLR